jgi:cellulose synthase/poly-beta-1,6-N-acetylglucosamine synthase-like glycosyltransferase
MRADRSPRDAATHRQEGLLLRPEESAERTLTRTQLGVLLALLLGSAVGGWTNGVLGYLTGLVGVVTIFYFVVLAFKSLLAVASVRPGSIQVTRDELAAVASDELPTYSILVPLYREKKILATLLTHLKRLDYPKDKLQVVLLVESDDTETIHALRSLRLPFYFETVIVPVSHPRTKPKACNIGLAHVRGSFCVIYDAEDRPEPDQLKKAVLAFRKAPENIVCLQAKLQYWNPETNGLTRFFAAEYATYFNLVLPGLARWGLPVPLGGTSNHFRTAALQEMGGWDAFNVTEDIDLGIRLARVGGAVEILDSITWEEANSQVGNWLRQRSRWVKGHIQTYFVHMRSPRRLFADLGPLGFLSFQITVGGTALTLLLNPIFWTLTVVYVATGSVLITSLYPPVVYYLGVGCMVVGNFAFMYYTMSGAMIRGRYADVKWMLIAPAYWMLMSLAAWKAAIQLVHKPHYWEKTDHGLVPEEAIALAQDSLAVDGFVASGGYGSADR